ncbi:MAG: helix-turn-helix transcriptional regulator [Bacteroidia bacterium]
MKPRMPGKVPILDPLQFDDYLFQNWKPVVSGFYERFHIARIESYKNHMKIPLPPHRRSVCFFIYLTNGMAIRSKGLTQFEIRKNHFFFLPANQITSLEYFSEGIQGYYCHFQPEILNQTNIKIDPGAEFPFFRLLGNPLVEVKETENVLSLLNILEKEYKKNIDDHFELIPVYLTALLMEARKYVTPQKKQSKNAASYITQRYLNALSEFVYEYKTVAEFADHLSVSSNHLHKCVKTTTGKSAHYLLGEMRILEAKVLLKQTSLSVGEIAFKVGRFSASDFCRFFKSRTQMTPLEYRNLEI